MIDFKKMEEYLDFISSDLCNKKFIPRGEIITIDELEKLRILLKKYGITNFKKTFCTQDDIKRTPFIVQCKCRKCGEIFTKEVSTINLISIIKQESFIFDDMYYLCDMCYLEKTKQESIERKKREEKKKQEELENTKYVIEFFFDFLLNPNYSWKKSCNYKNRIDDCKYSSSIAKEELGQDYISDFINELGYSNYLKTPYWKTLSQHIKYKNNYKCSLCGCNENLVAHHNTYEHIGNEFEHLEDVVCICQNCHEKYHFD